MVIRAMKRNKSELENRNKGYRFKVTGQDECNLLENVALEWIREGAGGRSSSVIWGKSMPGTAHCSSWPLVIDVQECRAYRDFSKVRS